LICFLENPVLELSNNLAQNAIRPVVLGRRNWIHIGSKEVGPCVAAIISVVESCRRFKTPVRDYLGSVLPGLGETVSLYGEVDYAVASKVSDQLKASAGVRIAW
jgi:transposase